MHGRAQRPVHAGVGGARIEGGLLGGGVGPVRRRRRLPDLGRVWLREEQTAILLGVLVRQVGRREELGGDVTRPPVGAARGRIDRGRAGLDRRRRSHPIEISV